MDIRRTRVKNGVMSVVSNLTINVEAIHHSWGWRCLAWRNEMSVKISLRELKKTFGRCIEIVVFSEFDWVECFLENCQHWFRLWVRESWLLCRSISLEGSLALSVSCEPSDIDLLGLLFVFFVLNFMHFYIERVLARTLIWLVHLQVFYIILVLLIIFIVHSWITNIFKHITFSSYVDLIRNSLNFCARLLSSLTISALLCLSHGCR